MSCTWPIFSEESVTENEDCNDFDPILSQQWAMGVTLLDDLPVLLSEAVEEFFKLSTKRETLEQLLGKLQSTDGEFSSNFFIAERLNFHLETTNSAANMADPIKRISDSRTQQYWSSISSSISHTTRRLRVNIFNPPLPTNTVEKTIEYLFETRSSSDQQRSLANENTNDIEEIRRFKSVPNDSFVHRLLVTFIAACSLPSYNHQRSIAHLWFDVFQEIRTRWETGELIPGLESGSPNLSYSKFYQNLQMLNCCIEHRVQLQQENNPADTSAEIDEDGDLFYECESNPTKPNPDEIQAEGRLKPCADLKLLDHDEILYVPITQVG